MKHILYIIFLLPVICVFICQESYAAFPIHSTDNGQNINASIKGETKLNLLRTFKTSLQNIEYKSVQSHFKDQTQQKEPHSKKKGRSALNAAGVLFGLCLLLGLALAAITSQTPTGGSFINTQAVFIGFIGVLAFLASFICFIVWLANQF